MLRNFLINLDHIFGPNYFGVIYGHKFSHANPIQISVIIKNNEGHTTDYKIICGLIPNMLTNP